MTQKFVQTPIVYLYSGMAASDSSVVITPYPRDIQTNRKLVFADFGATPTFTVDPRVSGYEEICSFTGLTDNGDNTGTLTGLTRNLIGESPYTTSGTGKQHGASSTLVFSNNPQMYARMASLENSNTFTNLNLFSGYAPQTDTDPVSANDLTRLAYVQALVLGTLTTINVIVPGTAGTTITKGQSIYYDDPTNQWKLTDATSSSTVDDVLLGIAQSSATVGVALTVLLQGVDSNQSGLTDGVTQFASNTPGAISSSAGTISVVLGISKGTTQLYFAPRFNQQITANQLAAMAGTSGTPPSGSNKFVDNADTAGTGLVQRASQITALAASKATFVAAAAITAGQALHVTPYYQSDGGIVIDNQSANIYANATNQSQAFSVGSGANRAMLIAVDATSAPTTVAYAGVNATLVDSQAVSTGHVLYVYKLLAPTSGANNIVVTGTNIYGISANSFTGVSQSTFVEVSAKANLASVSITTLSQGAMVAYFQDNYHSASTASFASSSYGSKYSNLINATTSSAAGAIPTCILASYTSKFNETLTTVPSGAFTGGSGTVADAIIAVSLAPATAVSIGVLPTNSSAITVNEPLIDLIGFADSSVAINASIVVTIAGIVTGLSGLTPGKRYFLQDSNGTLGLTGGTYRKVAGKALSSTTLILSPEKTVSTPISKVTAVTYFAECDGFASTNATGANGSILTDGVTTSFTGTATNGSNIRVPVSRGQSYVITSAGSGLYFTPFA